ncbi:zinc finger SWIM domain-containing protein 7 isoform 2-T2 [Leptosomus discolor]
MNTILPAVAEELLKEIKKAFQETSHVPDDLLLGLKFIFGPSAVPALDLVDQRSVTRVTSPSGRTAYQNCMAACRTVKDLSIRSWQRLWCCLTARWWQQELPWCHSWPSPPEGTPPPRSLGAQANSTPATVPATSARVLLLVLLYCRRARAFCANIYLLSTSVRPWEPARNYLSPRSSSQASYWLKKRMKDEGFGSHADVLSVYPSGCVAGTFHIYKAHKCSSWLADFFLSCSQV